MREILLSMHDGWPPPGPPGLWLWVSDVKTVGGRDLWAPASSRSRVPVNRSRFHPSKGSASGCFSNPAVDSVGVVSHPTRCQVGDMLLGTVTIGLIDLQERDVQNRRTNQREQVPQERVLVKAIRAHRHLNVSSFPTQLAGLGAHVGTKGREALTLLMVFATDQAQRVLRAKDSLDRQPQADPDSAAPTALEPHVARRPLDTAARDRNMDFLLIIICPLVGCLCWSRSRRDKRVGPHHAGDPRCCCRWQQNRVAVCPRVGHGV